jgi:hypothetical protein
MKNVLLTVFFCVFAFGFAQAQISKPVTGNRLVEMRGAGLANLGSGLNQQYGGAMLRIFKSDVMAHRWAVDMGLTFDNELEEDKFTLDNISVNWGMENHMAGSKRMSTYWGYDAGLRAASNFDNIAIQGGVFTGFDYYVADGWYVGTEIGYRLSINLDPFKFQLPGTGMNASLKMGYRL